MNYESLMVAEDNKDFQLLPSTRISRHWPVNISESDRDDFRDDIEYETGEAWIKKRKHVWVSPDSVVYNNGILLNDT
ncbi:MAG TPA: hypothetical protein VLJ68_11260, partial [Chitinophagaceae bacterium]|nr:hypothetical protein [Chitinophagaceae bacterium]